jgi:CRP-like cAMP-binding protein
VRRRAARLGQLTDVGLFSGLSRGELSIIARVARQIAVPAGEVLCEQGSPGHEFFLIVQGEAAVERGRRRVTTLGPGGHFGELALLDRAPRSATVRALTGMTLLVVEELDFTALLDEVPALAHKLLAALASRLREAEAVAFD